MIKYKQAPLPFQGQKRNFLTLFAQEIKDAPANSTFVDLFGGSGLISRTIKDIKPQSTVIYNDYDNYSERVKKIRLTNIVLRNIREVITSPLEAKLTKEEKQKVIDILESFKDIDVITISSSLLFSGNFTNEKKELYKQTFYNNVRKSDIPNTDNYLQGLNVVSCDYKELIEKYKNVENVIFIADPPYLATDVKSYKDKYWGLTAHLNLFIELINTKLIFFTSNKSQTIEVLEWMKTNFDINVFGDLRTIKRDVLLNYNSGYTDVMLSNLKYKPIQNTLNF